MLQSMHLGDFVIWVPVEPAWYDALPALVKTGDDRQQIINAIVSAWSSPFVSLEDARRTIAEGGALVENVRFVDETTLDALGRPTPIDLSEILRAVETNLRDEAAGQAGRSSATRFILMRGCAVPMCGCHEVKIRATFAVTGVAFGDHASFEGAEFDGGASFAFAIFGHGARFHSARFVDATGFMDVTFGHQVTFEHAKFCKASNFSNAKFRTQSSFAYAEFGEDTTFSYTEFGGRAYFDYAIFRGAAKFYQASLTSASFDSATFSKRVMFDLATFRNHARFQSARFANEASFICATLGSNAVFADAEFGYRANFYSATFGDDACFRSAKFGDAAKFSTARFGNRADFSSAVFGRGAVFTSAGFDRDATFARAQFRDFAYFESARFGGNASFASALFGDDAVFTSATYGDDASFSEATLSDRASFNFSKFGSNATFRSAIFGARSRFDAATFGDGASFSGATFGSRASFNSARFGTGALFLGTRFGPLGGVGDALVHTIHRMPRWTKVWRMNWSHVRALGELRVLTRISYASLALVPLLAGAWSGVAPVVRGYNSYAAEAASITESARVLLEGAAEHLAFTGDRATESSDALRHQIERWLALDESTEMQRARDVLRLWCEASQDLGRGSKESAAMLAEISDTVAKLPAPRINPPRLAKGWAVGFFAALAAVLGHLVYQAAAPQRVREGSADDLMQLRRKDFAESGEDDRRDRLNRAFESLARVAKIRPWDRHPDFVRRQGETIWIPTNLDVRDSLGQGSVAPHQLAASVSTTIARPRFTKEELDPIVIEEGARAEFDVAARESFVWAGVATVLYLAASVLVLWLTLQQSAAVLDAVRGGGSAWAHAVDRMFWPYGCILFAALLVLVSALGVFAWRHYGEGNRGEA